MPRSRAVPLALAFLLALSAAARADEIVTRTGARYEGKILSEDATHVVIETSDLGTLRVPKSDVAKINGKDVAEAPAKPNPPAPVATKDPAAKAGPGAAAQPKPAPLDPADEAKRREDEAKARAEQEATDAAARLARRKAATLKRRTEPGAEKSAPEAPRAKSEQDLKREQERESIGGAQLAKTPRGTRVIVFEPPAPFAAAPSGLVLGRRSWATFEVGGTASASLTMNVGGAPRRLTLRLADVQRHTVVKDDAQRARLFEGVDEGTWLRVLLDDGTTASGRFGGLADQSVRLTLPVDDGPSQAADVPCARVVQVEGLLRSVGVDRALGDLEPDEPVGIVLWPDGREIVGRFADRMEHQIRLDTDADGEPDAIVPSDAPVADVRRIPVQWRAVARSTPVGGRVRLRGGDEFGDARVERVFATQVQAVTAYAIAVKTDDGCAILPFESVVAWEPASESEEFAASRHLAPEATNLPVLPGMTAAAAQAIAKDLPKGLSFVTDGTVVTHVYVAPPYARDVLGLRVGASAEENLSAAEIWFGTDVKPRGRDDSGEDRARELISETVDGLRVTAYVDPKGPISAIELTRR